MFGNWWRIYDSNGLYGSANGLKLTLGNPMAIFYNKTPWLIQYFIYHGYLYSVQCQCCDGISQEYANKQFIYSEMHLKIFIKGFVG